MRNINSRNVRQQSFDKNNKRTASNDPRKNEQSEKIKKMHERRVQMRKEGRVEPNWVQAMAQEADRAKKAQERRQVKKPNTPTKGAHREERKKGFAPPQLPHSIFLTGGIGDIFAIESFFSDEQRKKLETIYYATHKQPIIQKLFEALPNYPNLKKHIVVWDDFSNFWCFLRKEECIRRINAIKKEVDPGFYQAADFGIVSRFANVNSGIDRWSKSSFLKHKLCTIDHLSLPPKFIAICPYSTDKRQTHRDFNQNDWEALIRSLEEQELCGVVIHEDRTNESYVPNHKSIINLTNKTTILEAVEILKKSSGYVGIDSCLSVLAAQLFTPRNIVVKSHNTHLFSNKHIYYSPVQDFSFIGMPSEKLGRFLAVGSKANQITLDVVQGVGDIFWIYQKLAPYFDIIDLNILVTDNSHVQRRSTDWVKLLPKIGLIDFKLVSGDDYNRVVSTKYSLGDLFKKWNSGNKTIEYCCNLWLEEGTRIEEIDPESKLMIDVPMKTEPFELPFKEYVLLYVSGATKQIHPQKMGAWSTSEWIELIDCLYHKYNINYPIIVIGADFDQDVVYEISDHLAIKGCQTARYVQLPPPKVLHLLKSTKFFVGFQSGLNIIADNLDTKQLMIYYNHLEKMMFTWCKKVNLENNIYNAFTFKESPENIIAKLPDNLLFN